MMKNLRKRALSIFLAFMLCASLVPTAAFATDGDEGGASGAEGNTTTTTVTPDKAPIPDDAKTETKTETSTNPENGNKTETTTTDKTWESTDKTDGTYGDKKDVTVDKEQSETVDKLTGENPDLDNIEDGTYTKTETQGKTDVDVNVKGEDHRSDSTTTKPNGFVSGDSFEQNGQQTTTKTTTDTTKTTTTTVNKETGTTESNPGLEKGEETGKTADGNPITSTIPGNATGPEKVPSEINASTSNETQENQGGNVTVTLKPGTDGKDTQTVTDTSSRAPTLPNLNEIFNHVAGWEVKGTNGEVIGTIDEKGIVTKADGTTYQAGFVQDGKTWTFTLNAVNAGDFTKAGESSVTDKVGDIVGDKTVKPGDESTEYGKYGAPTTDANGNTVYTKEDVTTRTDSNEWTEITGITEEQWEQLTDYFNRTITVTLGEARQVTGNLTITTGNNNGKLELNVAGNIIKDQNGELQYNKDDNIDGAYYVGYKVGDGNHRDNTNLYAIKGDNGVILGYCLEKGTHLDKQGDSRYELVNLEDALSYGEKGESNSGLSYINSDDVAHLNYIAKYGYWGGGDAELQSFNNSVGGNFTKEQAISITQAAIWRFADPLGCTWGDPHENNPDKNNPFYLYPKNNEAYTISKKDREAAFAAYKKLIGRTEDNTDQTQVVTSSDITSATITVKEKVDSIDELTALVAETNQGKLEQGGATVIKGDKSDTYKVDASVTMAITPSKIGEDLFLHVYVGDKKVASARLHNNEFLSGKEIKKSGTDGNVIYSVEDLAIGEGMSISFKIEGTQSLKEGVYLFQDNKYQNFGALVKDGSTRHVDIAVNMDFSVNEGKETVSDSQESHQDKVTRTDTKTTTQKYKSETEYENTKTTTVTVKTTVTEVETPKSTTETNKVEWSDEGSNTYTEPGRDRPSRTPDPEPTPEPTPIPEEDVPLTPAPEEPTVSIPEEDVPLAPAPETPDTPDVTLPEPEVPLAPMPPEVSIPDEEVPLAGVPSTGEEVGNWLQLSLVCMAGLVILAIGKRREEV